MKSDTRIRTGQHLSPSTEFKTGQHWRSKKPWWDKEWLFNAYIVSKKSASEIADEHDCTPNNIYFWLEKHGINARTVSEARTVKHWGCKGDKNPMYRMRGVLNPNWKGGLTPLRQKYYASSEWKSLAKDVYKRDGKKCRLCGSLEKIHIHHIDPFSQSPLLVMDIGNLLCLCSKCHRKITGKEMRWRKRLFQLINSERR